MAETTSQTLRRRLVTIPCVVLAFWVVSGSLPALLLLALLIDLVRGGKTFSTTRLTGFLFCFLAVENFGLLLLAWTWASTPANSRARAARTFAIQRLYTAGHLRSVTWLFSLQFVVQGADQVLPGPLLVFVRHASLVDVLVPGGFIANVHQLELRYVLKRELLAEPCLDVAGHWIPNHFVDRRGKDTAAEVAAVRALKQDLRPNEGVIIYPEGTPLQPRQAGGDPRQARGPREGGCPEAAPPAPHPPRRRDDVARGGAPV